MFGTRPTNLQITTSSIMRAQRANCPVRQDAPSRYRLRRVVSRSVLPRERFRPLAQNGHGAMSDLSPLCAAKRTCQAIHDPICFRALSGAVAGALFQLTPSQRSHHAGPGPHRGVRSATSNPRKPVTTPEGLFLPVAYSIGKSSGTLPNVRSTVVLDTGYP